MKCCDNNIIVDKITCSECNFEQDLSNFCSNCSVQFATNYCDICKLYTDKNITHCEFCKICRIGNEDLFHCFNCNGCFFSINKSSHQCQINLLDKMCSVCNESIFNSRYNTHISECGHPIHENCLQDSLKHGQYKCSLCKKSIINMNAHWNLIKTNIKNTPLPQHMIPIYVDDIVDSPYGKFKILEKNFIVNNITMYNGIFMDWKMKNNMYAKATLNENALNKKLIKEIYCNDCEQKSLSEYHFYGIECKSCGSFNTQE